MYRQAAGRIIVEAQLVVVGPNPFPVYSGTTAGTSTGARPPRAKSRTSAHWQAWPPDTADAAAARRRLEVATVGYLAWRAVA